MEQQGTKKRRKVTLESTPGSGGDEQRETAIITLASAVVSDPLQHMVGFLEHDPERLNLALSCKSMHRTVEVYSKAALAKIEQDYHVDETFAERIRDPSRICFTGGLHPVSEDLPYRYLLKAARFTHLYMLDEMMKGTRSGSFSCASALSENGGRLVVAAAHPYAGEPNFVYAWNVSAKPGAKKKVYEIPAETREYKINGVFCTEELIVTCTNWRIFTLAINTGDLTQAYTHPTEVRSGVWGGVTGVVFLDDDDKVYSFNVSTGMAHFVAQLTFSQPECNIITGLVNDRWLVIHKMRRRDCFRVFDLSNGCRQSCFYRVDFLKVEQSQTSPDMFYSVDYTQCHVFQLNEQGKFSIVRSFTVPLFSDEDYWREGPQSRWFFEKNRFSSHDQDEETSMTVRCSESGERQGSYKLPANHWRAYGMDIHWNENKLFVGLAPKGGDGVCVAAFLAKEHF